MRFGFLNNFAAQLAAPVADDATEIELSTGAEAIATALENADTVALTLFVVDAQGNETKREVVYAIAAASPFVTVTRGEEGTDAEVFNPGDSVEARLTAEALSNLSKRAYKAGFNNSSGTFIAAFGDESHNADPLEVGGAVIIGQGSAVYNQGSIAIGMEAFAGDESEDAVECSVALGAYTISKGTEGVAMGAYAQCDGEYSISIGRSSAQANQAIAIGRYANAWSGADYSVVVGQGASANGEASVSVGANANAIADSTTVMGYFANASGKSAIAIGESASASAEGSISLGRNSSNNMIPGGMRTTAVPYIPSFPGNPQGAEPNSARSTASQVAIASPSLNFSEESASVSIEIPQGCLFFAEKIDAVITNGSGSGEPVLHIEDSDNNVILAAGVITHLSNGNCTRFEAEYINGVTELTITLSAMGTGTLGGYVIAKGYVMQA